MIYTIKDRHGFDIGIIEVSQGDLTPSQLDVAMKKYIKKKNITSVEEFYTFDFQKYLASTYNVRSVEHQFDVLNTQV